ncbi:hypothetical protein [Acinetobacter sp. CAAS 2-6]|uniref:hypothetical protein n=1 Tax=Acinetobacter sp. CAAS 2-6 TaxID=3016358 RepID=UPI002DD6681E|nr:hypothetical protein [Acinetobacter sp. CAAS 2-6]
MALDQIWKQQLTLVSYGNEYLQQNLPFSRWLQHAIFFQHTFEFRDLLSQHLLAPHFQIWLEGLKKQGVSRLSLHLSSILNEEKNPNGNVELLPYSHFIVSHQGKKKTAWILGHELAEWYTAEEAFVAPLHQRSNIQQSYFWRFELNQKLAKKVDADLEAAAWAEIQKYTSQELFQHPLAQGYQEPEQCYLPYYGISREQIEAVLGQVPEQIQFLAVLPTDYSADLAHQLLHRIETLSIFIEHKKQHPYSENREILSPEVQLNLRHFAQRIDDLFAKLIVKAANHYQSAGLVKVETPTPLDTEVTTNLSAQPAVESAAISSAQSTPHAHKVGASGVIKLILVTIIICVVAYYFGL